MCSIVPPVGCLGGQSPSYLEQTSGRATTVSSSTGETSSSSSVTLGSLCPRAGEVVVPQKQYNKDHHSYSRPREVELVHKNINFIANFDTKELFGTVEHTFKKNLEVDTLYLDTKGLQIQSIKDVNGNPLEYQLSEADPLLGSALAIKLPTDGNRICISFVTSPTAEGLYWNSEDKTVYSHSQPIYTRSWLPCQDTPSVRTTYTATFTSENSPGQRSLMSSQNNPRNLSSVEGDHTHVMEIPTPSYLMAFALGCDYQYRATGERTGIYASSQVIDQAHTEFSHLETILTKAEELFGSYGDWGRYDMLILTSDFPAGATENPCITFFGPAILSGDGSNAYIVYHELAHSWAGNKVTAASWEHLWMNEGLTSYWENRLLEHIEGYELAAMLVHRNHQILREDFKTLSPEDQRLRMRLKKRNPRDSFGNTAYYKGLLFFKMLEHHIGREPFDAFMKQYFNDHKYKSVTTESFENYLDEHLLNNNPELKDSLRIHEWLYEPGIPENVYLPPSTRFAEIANIREAWVEVGSDEFLQAETKGYRLHEWRAFISGLKNLPPEQLRRLDMMFNFKEHRNLLIRDAWFTNGLNCGYYDIFPDVQNYIINNSKPALVKRYVSKLMQINTPESVATAMAIYDAGMVKFSTRARTALEQSIPLK
jgi:leukotriene-A4 hydrolase